MNPPLLQDYVLGFFILGAILGMITGWLIAIAADPEAKDFGSANARGAIIGFLIGLVLAGIVVKVMYQVHWVDYRRSLPR